VIPVLHLRQGTALYGADRAVLALSASTAAPYAPIVGAISRPGAPDVLAEEARRRGLAAVHFDSASRIDLRCARAVARLARERGVRLLHAHDFKALFVALVESCQQPDGSLAVPQALQPYFKADRIAA